jgi:hypothetical protein
MHCWWWGMQILLLSHVANLFCILDNTGHEYSLSSSDSRKMIHYESSILHLAKRLLVRLNIFSISFEEVISKLAYYCFFCTSLDFLCSHARRFYWMTSGFGVTLWKAFPTLRFKIIPYIFSDNFILIYLWIVIYFMKIMARQLLHALIESIFSSLT